MSGIEYVIQSSDQKITIQPNDDKDRYPGHWAAEIYPSKGVLYKYNYYLAAKSKNIDTELRQKQASQQTDWPEFVDADPVVSAQLGDMLQELKEEEYNPAKFCFGRSNQAYSNLSIKKGSGAQVRTLVKWQMVDRSAQTFEIDIHIYDKGQPRPPEITEEFEFSTAIEVAQKYSAGLTAAVNMGQLKGLIEEIGRIIPTLPDSENINRQKKKIQVFARNPAINRKFLIQIPVAAPAIAVEAEVSAAAAPVAAAGAMAKPNSGADYNQMMDMLKRKGSADGSQDQKQEDQEPDGVDELTNEFSDVFTATDPSEADPSAIVSSAPVFGYNQVGDS